MARTVTGKSKSTAKTAAPKAAKTSAPSKAAAPKPAAKPAKAAKPAPEKAAQAAPSPAADAQEVVVWHNPACGSSKNALAYLQDKGVQPKLYLYLKEKPGKAEIKAVLKKLGIKAAELLRPGEAKGEALGLYAGASETAIIDAMAAEASLIQRPVVITARGAVIARPKTRIDEIL